MVAGILILAALGAEPTPGLRLEMPPLRLAQVDSPPPFTASDWPVAPDRTKHKISLIAPIAMLSVGAALGGLSAVGVTVFAGQSCGGDQACNLGPIALFGLVGVVGGLLFLAGTIWLIIDLAVNADRVDAHPSSVADSPSAPRRRGTGLLVTTF